VIRLFWRLFNPRRLAAIPLVILLAGWLFWSLGPFQALFEVTRLSNPSQLATLGKRGANPRLNQIVYWLDIARSRGIAPESAIDLAQFINGTHRPRADLVKESLLRNLKIAEELGLFTEENGRRMRRGHGAVVMKGPYRNSRIEIDHIVPISLAPETGNELANLEMLPQPLNRMKSNAVGERQLAHARKLLDAGLLTRESYDRVVGQGQAKPYSRELQKTMPRGR
jgi:hypothetical protein